MEIEIDLDGVEVIIDCPACAGGDYDAGEGCRICKGTGEVGVPVKRGVAYHDISDEMPTGYNEGML